MQRAAARARLKGDTIIWSASPWRAEFEKITNNRPIKAPHHSLYQHPPLHQAQNEERRAGLWKMKGKAVALERCCLLSVAISQSLSAVWIQLSADSSLVSLFTPSLHSSLSRVGEDGTEGE